MLLDNRILATAYAAMLEDLEDAPPVTVLRVSKSSGLSAIEKEDKRRDYEAYQRELGWKQKRQNVINETGVALYLLKQQL